MLIKDKIIVFLMFILFSMINGCILYRQKISPPILGETTTEVRNRWGDLYPDDLDKRRNWQRYYVWDSVNLTGYFVTFVNDTAYVIGKRSL